MSSHNDNDDCAGVPLPSAGDESDGDGDGTVATAQSDGLRALKERLESHTFVNSILMGVSAMALVAIAIVLAHGPHHPRHNEGPAAVRVRPAEPVLDAAAAAATTTTTTALASVGCNGGGASYAYRDSAESVRAFAEFIYGPFLGPLGGMGAANAPAMETRARNCTNLTWTHAPVGVRDRDAVECETREGLSYRAAYARVSVIVPLLPWMRFMYGMSRASRAASQGLFGAISAEATYYDHWLSDEVFRALGVSADVCAELDVAEYAIQSASDDVPTAWGMYVRPPRAVVLRAQREFAENDATTAASRLRRRMHNWSLNQFSGLACDDLDDLGGTITQRVQLRSGVCHARFADGGVFVGHLIQSNAVGVGRASLAGRLETDLAALRSCHEAGECLAAREDAPRVPSPPPPIVIEAVEAIQGGAVYVKHHTKK